MALPGLDRYFEFLNVIEKKYVSRHCVTSTRDTVTVKLVPSRPTRNGTKEHLLMLRMTTLLTAAHSLISVVAVAQPLSLSLIYP
jgi:hypothetical protein